jgi:dihydrodipicolinate synthase/N-acetylneuraminate lyase
LSIPSVTILDERNRVIEGEQRRVFRHNAQQGYGADIIFGVGTTGEWNRISNHERQRLMEIEVDEIATINREFAVCGKDRIEAWVGVTGDSCAETIANLECALDLGADAAVIAPLSIRDAGNLLDLFQRQVNDLFDNKGRALPVFLYDNADIAVDPRLSHIHTRDVKKLSRLPFISGVKVSASRRVLGNYTRGALHYKDKGEFGIYIGNALLMFQVFRLGDSFFGRVREYWNRYLLHDELPIGVVSGPANVLPREWQRAWRACYVGDERLMAIYQPTFEMFNAACRFGNQEKMLACLKYAMKLDGIIECDRVADGTPALEDEERKIFGEKYRALKSKLLSQTNELWISIKEADSRVIG